MTGIYAYWGAQILIGCAPFALLGWTAYEIDKLTKEPWRTHGFYLYLWLAAVPHAVAFVLCSLLPLYGPTLMTMVALSYGLFAAVGWAVAGALRLARRGKGHA